MGTEIIRVENISFGYGRVNVLDNVSTSIIDGDFLGIVGPNGSGKSTLLRIFLGLIKPQKGTVRVFDTDIEKFDQWGKIGYIPQKATSFNQGFPATVEEVVSANLYPIVGLAGRIKKAHKEKVDEALRTVGMLEKKKSIIGRLSGGQQQRVFIAKALVSAPRVIFMDEPTVGIDRNSEESFYELMKSLNRERGITLVMVTHDIGAIDKRVNRVLCLSEGKLYEHDCAVSQASDIFKEAYGKRDSWTITHRH
ncbi:MAG: ABC transporter ATP-binding protein [Gracilibacteraceae bacterium]|jgi:zinc transport system ATP-binding protein|nr:ABC transporter ATP-binding protein [Gracilibacteraceae bacterium]